MFLFKTISQEKSFLSIHLPYPVEGLFIYLLLSIIYTYSTQRPKTHLPYLLIPSSKTISKRLNMLFLCSFKGVFPPSTDYRKLVYNSTYSVSAKHLSLLPLLSCLDPPPFCVCVYYFFLNFVAPPRHAIRFARVLRNPPNTNHAHVLPTGTSKLLHL